MVQVRGTVTDSTLCMARTEIHGGSPQLQTTNNLDPNIDKRIGLPLKCINNPTVYTATLKWCPTADYITSFPSWLN